MLEASINARNIRTNKELDAIAKSQFEVLNAPLRQLAQQFESFGKYLPESEMHAFAESLKNAKAANEALAMSIADVEHRCPLPFCVIFL